MYLLSLKDIVISYKCMLLTIIHGESFIFDAIGGVKGKMSMELCRNPKLELMANTIR